jgi:HK97 gp10 family phage protein
MARVIGKPSQTGLSVTGGIQVLGVREAIAALEGAGRIARISVGLLVHNAAESMAERARENIHNVTGNLESGTRAEQGGPYYWNVISSSLEGDDPSGTGKNQKEYAGFVEFGTSKMSPRFYMTRAYADTRPEVVAELQVIASEISLL